MFPIRLTRSRRNYSAIYYGIIPSNLLPFGAAARGGRSHASSFARFFPTKQAESQGGHGARSRGQGLSRRRRREGIRFHRLRDPRRNPLLPEPLPGRVL